MSPCAAALPTIAASLVGSLIASQAQLSTVGKIEVRLDISTGCEVAETQHKNNQITGFGILDFGESGPIWHEELAAKVNRSDGSIMVACSPDIAGFTVAIDGGLRGNRTLAHADSSQLVAYDVFRDAAHSKEYAVDVPQTFSVNGEPVEVPVFGVINSSTKARISGLYLDTLLVTIDF